jgi:hypothetical protein
VEEEANSSLKFSKISGVSKRLLSLLKQLLRMRARFEPIRSSLESFPLSTRIDTSPAQTFPHSNTGAESFPIMAQTVQ